MVEGEKDVHAIESAGGVVTCNPMGAGNWSKVDPSPLYGGSIVVVADKDATGYANARDVHASLDGKVQSLQVVIAREGKDAAAHIAAGHEFDRLHTHRPQPAADHRRRRRRRRGRARPDRRVRTRGRQGEVAAQVHEAARDQVAAEKAAAIPIAPFDADLLAGVLARPPEPEERVRRLIPTAAATLIVAQRKTGKATLLLNLARSLIGGACSSATSKSTPSPNRWRS